MFLEIVSTDATLLRQEVKAVTVPGILGSFQVLENHAPLVSVLEKGNVIIADASFDLDEQVAASFSKSDNKYILPINSGTIEINNNKVMVLVD